MKTYAPGADILVTLSLLDEAGEIQAPASLRWRVLDEDEQVLLDWAAIDPNSILEDFVAVTVPAAQTHVSGPRGLRTIEVELTLEAGLKTLSESILLQGQSALTVGTNSFCTYSRALLVVEDFTESTMSGWRNQSQRAERERALIEACRGVLALPLYLRSSSDNRSLVEVIDRDGFARVKELDPALVTALQRAQVLEASELLSADPTMTARRNGLLSMTVGESSQYFGTAKPLEMPVVSRQALEVLSRWISYSVRIGRA